MRILIKEWLSYSQEERFWILENYVFDKWKKDRQQINHPTTGN